VWQLGTSWDCMCSLVSSPSVLPLEPQKVDHGQRGYTTYSAAKGPGDCFVFPQLVPLVGRGAELGAVTPNACGMGWRLEA
jgi:hypothetical protein